MLTVRLLVVLFLSLSLIAIISPGSPETEASILFIRNVNERIIKK